jgi:leucyl aminopeptidase
LLKIMTKDLTEDRVETLVIPTCEGSVIHDDRRVASLVRAAGKMTEFSGKKRQKITFYNPKGLQVDRAVLIGLGKKGDLDREGLRVAAGLAVKDAMAGRLERIFFKVPSGKKSGIPVADLLESLMEGAFLANHVLGTYKKEKEKEPLKEAVMLVGAEDKKKFSRLPSRIEAACGGTLQARNWVNMPANLKSPAAFAREIVRHAQRVELKTTVVDDKALARRKFGAMLAVGAGSANKPRLVTLEYVPVKKARKTVVLVGKGVVFDSGGINLKPSAGLATMKTDMAGAAVVAATLIAAARLKPDVRLVGILPLVENMPSGRALRPGDIITSFSGKTIEVGNTDAEGRLILADAMAYGQKTFKPDVMVDVATLTGACVIALGEKLAGVFTREKALSSALVSAGEKTFERCWPMPMPGDYKELLKSDLADISNMSSTRYGGAIAAALFLSEFAGDVPWAHIDIAGPARNGRASDYCPAGGSGFGVRLLLELLQTI